MPTPDLDGWRRIPDEPLSAGDWADERVQAFRPLPDLWCVSGSTITLIFDSSL